MSATDTTVKLAWLFRASATARSKAFLDASPGSTTQRISLNLFI
jgi:hypothetical protein